mgnify:FL=1|tara:strand:- start:578 stop:1195 length:618 start_codon:yes stop_codon:yes gene_type:complete
MAIESGQAIGCSDLQAVGGTRYVLIREWKAGDLVTFATGEVTSIQKAGPVAADWGVYESRIESSSLTIAGTDEKKNVSTYECTLSFYLPKITKSKFDRLNEFTGKCLMAIVVDNNDATTIDTIPATTYDSNFVIGVSETFENIADNVRSQTMGHITSIEGGTGAAFGDENGVTVTITCTQYELPRKYNSAGAGISITGTTALTTG